MNPLPGDVLHRWDRNTIVVRCEQGCVFTEPSLSAHKPWVGVLFYRGWASHAEVVHMSRDSDCTPSEIDKAEGRS